MSAVRIPLRAPFASTSAGLLLLACLWTLAACEPVRSEPTMSCTSSAHCPADGKWTCNVQQGVCERCVGSCPGSSTTTDTSSSSDATSDTTASDTATADTGTDTATTDTTTEDTASTDTGSCQDRCGQFDLNWICNCDDTCGLYDDCCWDYEKLCVTSTDAGGTDTGSTDAVDTATDTTVTGG